MNTVHCECYNEVPHIRQSISKIIIRSDFINNALEVCTVHYAASYYNVIHCTLLQPRDGMQLHVEVLDFESDDVNNLIDRFVVEITNPVDTTSRRQTLAGTFGLASIDLTSRLQCAEDFYGPNCDVFCLQDCNIDRCAEATCMDGRVCVNGVLDYDCVCELGYTGLDCVTRVDLCNGVNCNFGSCSDEETFSVCVCYPGYMGQFCDVQQDGYELQVTLHSFNNPGGMCADTQCGQDYCCEGRACPNACEYHFSICQRPAGTPVSDARRVYQGDCDAFETMTSRIMENGTEFSHSIFGTPNPITLRGIRWVSHWTT